jgi:PAS domain S-box-containing protein
MQSHYNTETRIEELKSEIESLRLKLAAHKEEEESLDKRILEAVIGNIGTGFIVADTSGNILSQNDAALRMHDFRYEHEELKTVAEYNKVFTMEYPEGGKIPVEKWPLALALEGDYFRDYLVKLVNPKSRSRKIRFISYNTVPIYDKNGVKKFIVMTMSDLSDIRERTEALHESELRYQSLFNNFTMGMAHCRIITDDNGKPVDYRIIQVNNAYARISGLSKNDIEGKEARSVFPGLEGYAFDIIGRYGRVALEGEEINEEIFDERFKKWISLYAYSPKIGEFTSMFTDISERKAIEDKLEHERELFSSIFDNIPVMITIYDPEIKNFRFNKEFKRITSWTEKDAEGNFMEKVYPDPGYRSEVQEFMKSLSEGWQEYRLRAKDGQEIVSTWANKQLRNGVQIGIGIDIRQRKQAEESLRQSEQRLQSIFGNVAIGIVEVDSGDRIISANDRICHILGYTREELMSKTIHDITFPEDRDLTLRINEKIHKGDFGIIDYEKRYMKKDNTPFWVHVTISGVYDSNGRQINSIGTIEDITERKFAEEEREKLISQLALERQRLDTILRRLPAGVMIADDKGNINFANEYTIKLFGPDFITEGFNTIEKWQPRHPDGTPFRQEELPFVRAFRGLSTEGIEIRLRHKETGNYVYAEINAAPIKDEHARIVEEVITLIDITERRRFLEALKENEEKFRSVFENIIESIALHQVIYKDDEPADFSLIDVNKSFRENFGIDADSEAGVPLKEKYQSLGLPVLAEFFEVARNRQPYKFEASVENTGKHFIINVISPKKDQFATVFEDITEQKKNELEIRQKNEELTRFIYTVSHDLKSPLVTIKAFSNYLEEDIENNDLEARERDLNYIRNAADKMGKLLDELLELSRIGRKENPKEYITLESIIEAARDLVAGRLEQKKIQVKITGPPVMLYGHGQRFIQLYQNLLDNAAKFMGNQPDPMIEVGAFTDEKNEIVLFVKDNGKGIDPRYHHKIFGLFEKMDNETEGTGIGLALVKRIVEVHGGTIWFSSRGNGSGTTFYFKLSGTRLIN